MTEAWTYKTSFSIFKRAVERHHLLENGEKVLIGVSGGVDSMVLIHLIHSFNQRRHKKWDLLAVHIDPGFPKWHTQRLKKFFDALNIKYLISKIDVPNKLVEITNAGERVKSCFFCSRERRKRMFEIAEANGIKKIALAHHLEDVNETFFLNLLYVSEAKTFAPKQDFFQAQYHIIRPLYYFDKELILKYAKTYGLPLIKNKCPYEKESERNRIRALLSKFYTKNPRVKTNIFWGIKNAGLDFLPLKSARNKKVHKKISEKYDTLASVSQ
jgi:tRNA 2-thiocytidine biosynthesis protein TtcA